MVKQEDGWWINVEDVVEPPKPQDDDIGKLIQNLNILIGYVKQFNTQNQDVVNEVKQLIENSLQQILGQVQQMQVIVGRSSTEVKTAIEGLIGQIEAKIGDINNNIENGDFTGGNASAGGGTATTGDQDVTVNNIIDLEGLLKVLDGKRGDTNIRNDTTVLNAINTLIQNMNQIMTNLNAELKNRINVRGGNSTSTNNNNNTNTNTANGNKVIINNNGGSGKGGKVKKEPKPEDYDFSVVGKSNPITKTKKDLEEGKGNVSFKFLIHNKGTGDKYDLKCTIHKLEGINNIEKKQFTNLTKALEPIQIHFPSIQSKQWAIQSNTGYVGKKVKVELIVALKIPSDVPIGRYKIKMLAKSNGNPKLKRYGTLGLTIKEDKSQSEVVSAKKV